MLTTFSKIFLTTTFLFHSQISNLKSILRDSSSISTSDANDLLVIEYYIRTDDFLYIKKM